MVIVVYSEVTKVKLAEIIIFMFGSRFLNSHALLELSMLINALSKIFVSKRKWWW